jgi:poly-gamma-glutamate capsule biosynthesis protein CapA/YwtB (metallophosphatase superfamily)
MSFSIIAADDVVINGPLSRPSGKGSVYDHLRSADSRFANLEMLLTKSVYNAKKLNALKTDPIHAQVIRDIGIDVVTVANNHGMEYGVEGLYDTSKAFDAVGAALELKKVRGGFEVRITQA